MSNLCERALYAVVLGAALTTVTALQTAVAQERFQSPDEAAEALVQAANEENPERLLKVLGPSAAQIISSGDPVADTAGRKEFVAAYNAKHSVQPDSSNRATLVIGDSDFPFPIPLVRENESWQFDSAAGRREILYRRIGRNELDTIQVCLAYVDAQFEYAAKARDGRGPGTYAQRVISSPGAQDGLYWPSAAGGEEPSPLGELVAQASARGYQVGERQAPYHGYYFKILTKQGPSAPGGALDYVVKRAMIGGFALVAYPAEYRNSGVKTFLVSHSGIVYEKDLGPKTAETASRMTTFNPGPTWHVVEVQ